MNPLNDICVNHFVHRQTARSRFSYFQGSWEALRFIVRAAFPKAVPGTTPGVLLVPVRPIDFYSGIVQLQPGDKLSGIYESRIAGEAPRKHITSEFCGNKLPAVSVEIVVYASTLLQQTGTNNLPAEPGNYEIISINANSFDTPMPIHPSTLMANHFNICGGTPTGLSPSEFEQALRTSFLAWQDKAMHSNLD